MSRPDDEVIERVRVREAAGVFRARDRLDAAVDALLRAGFDRADIDVLAGMEAIRERFGGVYVAPEELADVPGIPRRPYLARPDLGAVGALGIASLMAGAAFAAAGAVIVSGGDTAVAAAAAVLAAVVAGVIGALVVTRFFERETDLVLDEDLAAGGIVLWVRVRTPEQEDRAQEILREHGAHAVRVHEVPLEMRVTDIPLGARLVDEPVGRP